MTTTNLISTKALTKSFNQMVALQRDVPFSLMFYALIQANAQPAQKLPKNFPELLPAKLRQFIPVKWDETKQEWRYNRARADKLLEQFDFTLNETTFEEMVDIIDSYLLTKGTEEKSDDEKVKAASSAIERQVVKMLQMGLDSAIIEVKIKDIILSAQKKSAGMSGLTATATEAKTPAPAVIPSIKPTKGAAKPANISEVC